GAGSAHTPAYQVGDAQGPPEHGGILGPPFPEPFHGVARLDREALDLTKAHNDVLGQAVGQVGVCRIAREVVEVQHREAVRGRRGGSCGAVARRCRAVGALREQTCPRRHDGNRQEEPGERFHRGAPSGRDSSTSLWKRGFARTESYSGKRRSNQSVARRGSTRSRNSSSRFSPSVASSAGPT